MESCWFIFWFDGYLVRNNGPFIQTNTRTLLNAFGNDGPCTKILHYFFLQFFSPKLFDFSSNNAHVYRYLVSNSHMNARLGAYVPHFANERESKSAPLVFCCILFFLRSFIWNSIFVHHLICNVKILPKDLVRLSLLLFKICVILMYLVEQRKRKQLGKQCVNINNRDNIFGFLFAVVVRPNECEIIDN